MVGLSFAVWAACGGMGGRCRGDSPLVSGAYMGRGYQLPTTRRGVWAGRGEGEGRDVRPPAAACGAA